MSSAPRVALFADSFHEVNGAALTCRQLDAFARRSGLPFLSVHCGPRRYLHRVENAWTLQLKRGRLAVKIDRDLSFDPFLFLRRHEVLETLREFRPNIVHITSPGDIGIIGAWAAHQLGAPLVASWHTNLHEFAATRLEKTFGFLPASWRGAIGRFTDRWVLDRVAWFYSLAKLTLAPNSELSGMLAERTGKPSFLMTRGIDTALYSPTQRNCAPGPFTLGFVGRVNPEKNVRFLATLEKALLAAGAPPFRFLVVGGGSEREWLQHNLQHGELPGVLTGVPLARAYANMDAFVFPSHTDTYGNVVLEAMASGVPAVVTSSGGPKFLVTTGKTGFVAANDDDFIAAVLKLMQDHQLHAAMRLAAREHARHFSWDRVFAAEVYASYSLCNPSAASGAGRAATPPPNTGKMTALSRG